CGRAGRTKSATGRRTPHHVGKTRPGTARTQRLPAGDHYPGRNARATIAGIGIAEPRNSGSTFTIPRSVEETSQRATFVHSAEPGRFAGAAFTGPGRERALAAAGTCAPARSQRTPARGRRLSPATHRLARAGRRLAAILCPERIAPGDQTAGGGQSRQGHR